MINKLLNKKRVTHVLTLGSNMKICPKSKRSQEEMLGFALIMIVVAVALLVFLGFSVGKAQREEVNNYEVESFIWAFLQYTTGCAENYEPNYLSIEKLIVACNNQEICFDEQDSCEVLEAELQEIVEKSWEGRPIQGYELNVWAEEEEIMLLEQGNKTKEYEGAMQPFPHSINISFTAYY